MGHIKGHFHLDNWSKRVNCLGFIVIDQGLFILFRFPLGGFIILTQLIKKYGNCIFDISISVACQYS